MSNQDFVQFDLALIILNATNFLLNQVFAADAQAPILPLFLLLFLSLDLPLDLPPIRFHGLLLFHLPIWWVYFILSLEEYVRLGISLWLLFSKKWMKNLTKA